MVIVILVLTAAFAPILIALFGPSLWSLVRQLLWALLIHPARPVITLPKGWRRRVAWYVRPSKKLQTPQVEGKRMRDTV